MKTNKILMAMVLAAGFTACTSEELVESTQTNALNNRKVLGDIEFVMGEGVDSRFALENGKWKIETGDAFGAALVDVPNGQKNEDAYKNYNLTKYIQTNYQYAKGEGDVFTTPARMVEGNYVFYAPYNPNHLARTPMEVAFPITQTLDVNEEGELDPFSTINNALKEGYPFFVDYKFLSAEDQETSLTINFKHLYSYPEVKFVNNSKEAITLDKFVVVIGEGEEIPVKSTLNLTGGSETYAQAGSGIVGNLFNLGEERTDKTPATNETAVTWGDWVNYEVTGKNNLITGSTYDFVNEEGAVTSHITIEIPEGLTVAAGEEVKFYVVMPAKDYTDLNVYAMVDAEEGYAFAEIAEQLIPGQRYPYSDFVPSTGKLMAASKIGHAFTKTVKKNEEVADYSEEVLAPVSVATTSELIAAIRNAEETLKVIAGENVVYNESVADVLADSKTKVDHLIVLGDLAIAGTTKATEPLTIGTDVEVRGIATVKSGYTTIGMEKALKEVIVAKDATLNVASKITSLTNNGTVNAAATANIVASTNNNVMNIAGEGATVAVDNKKTLNINKKSANLTIKNFEAADATKNIAGFKGTVNVAVDYSTTTLQGDWNVTAGTLTLSANATINKKVTVSAGAKIKGSDITIAGGAELEVAGTLDANVKLDGVKAQPDATPAVALSIATLDLQEGAKVRETITVGTNGDYTSNYMEVADEVSFSKHTLPIANVNSTYKYTGNLPVASTEKFDVPAVCNTLVLTGSIDTEEGDYNMTTADNHVKYMTISGEVYLNKSDATITFPASMESLKITNDVEVVAGTVNFNGAKDVKVGGDLVVSGSISNANRMHVDGDVEISSEVTLSGCNLHVEKDIITAQSKYLTVAKLHVEGDVDLSGNVTANEVIVYAEHTLTVERGASVAAGSISGVKFTSIKDQKYYNDKTEYSSALTRGQVVNNGTIDSADGVYSKDALNETYGRGWWNGNSTTAI